MNIFNLSSQNTNNFIEDLDHDLFKIANLLDNKPITVLNNELISATKVDLSGLLNLEYNSIKKYTKNIWYYLFNIKATTTYKIIDIKINEYASNLITSYISCSFSTNSTNNFNIKYRREGNTVLNNFCEFKLYSEDIDLTNFRLYVKSQFDFSVFYTDIDINSFTLFNNSTHGSLAAPNNLTGYSLKFDSDINYSNEIVYFGYLKSFVSHVWRNLLEQKRGWFNG